MKRKLLLLPLLLLAMVARAEMKLTVKALSGADEQYALSQIGKITYEGEIMFLYSKQGDLLGQTQVTEIGKIEFEENKDDNTTTSIQNVHQGSIKIYPNPTQDMLIINGLSAGQTVRIYSLTGSLMQSVATTSTETNIQVSNLPNGTYLLQVGAEVVKFIKK